MITKILMPKFGLSMEEGTITSWLVKEGDEVKKGDEIAEVSTEKITNMVDAPEAGIVRKIIADVDSTVQCGEIIAIIAEAGDDISDILKNDGNLGENASRNETQKVEAVSKSTSKDLSEINITPRAKKVAEAKGVDYSSIKGTGIGGAITIDDVKKYIAEGHDIKAQKIEAPKENEKEARTEPKYESTQAESNPQSVSYSGLASNFRMNNMQKTIAKKMFESMATTAQTTISRDIDVTALVDWYNNNKGKYKNEGYKLSYTAVLIKVIAEVLQRHPKIRTRINGESTAETVNTIDIGVAVDVEDGLLVPIIKNANVKNLKTICSELVDLTNRAKQNKLSLDEMTGGTITITNLGMFGIKYFTPVLNTPESAILGVGAITQMPVIKNGGIFKSSIMNFSLTHDHRIINGAPAARFLMDINNILCDENELPRHMW